MFQSKAKLGTSLAELLRASSVERENGPLGSAAEKPQEIAVVDFTFALLMDENRNPVCIGFPLEGFDGDIRDAAYAATQAEICGKDLRLHGPRTTLKLLNVQPAVSQALDKGLTLVAFDKLQGIERVIPLTR